MFGILVVSPERLKQYCQLIQFKPIKKIKKPYSVQTYLWHRFETKKQTHSYTEEEMNMAAMNILSQPWSPPASLCLYNFYNHNHYNISNYKLHSFSHPDNFSLPSSLCAPTKSNHTASRLSQMPTHLSKSGSLSYFSFNF